jgi:hypothetical protein
MDRYLSMSSYGMINPTGGSLIRENPSGISTSYNTSLNTATQLETIYHNKRRRLADGAGCSSAAQDMSSDCNRRSQSKRLICSSIGAADPGDCTAMASIDQTSSKYKRRRLSGEPCWSTARDTYECINNLL